MDPQLLAALAAIARCAEETQASETEAAPALRGAASLWALHGRQGIMHMRALVQQRLLGR